jgi:hypothetical protein
MSEHGISVIQEHEVSEPCGMSKHMHAKADEAANIWSRHV